MFTSHPRSAASLLFSVSQSLNHALGIISSLAVVVDRSGLFVTNHNKPSLTYAAVVRQER